MDAPKCPLCEKRHYGLCADAVVPSEPKARKAAKKPARVIDARSDFMKLEERVEVLERIVAELCGFRKKRSEYMREYMARKRAEDKQDG